MQKRTRTSIALLLTLVLLCTLTTSALAASSEDVAAAREDTAAFLLEKVPAPTLASSGGEWTVLGLARSGHALPEGYLEGYYASLEQVLISRQGVLHERRYTEYARLVLALSAIGRDPAAIAGYNMLLPLADYEAVMQQGLNGAIFALLALDSGSYQIPENSQADTLVTRELYLESILSSQLANGGWALSGSTADPDTTALALQALAKYTNQTQVSAAVEKGLNCLAQAQNENGGYAAWGGESSESTAQVIVALCELGIQPTDSRFVKNGHSLLDALLRYYTPGQGFRHRAKDSSSSLMATEQCFYALVAAQRLELGQNSLYRMDDVAAADENSTPPQRHPDVQKQPLGDTQPSFSDIAGHPAQTAIEELARRGIITGITAQTFAPEQQMSRAQFTAIIVRALGLTATASGHFRDVAAAAWYAPYVDTAYTYGIAQGVGPEMFDPAGTITREQAATMVASAAALCGLNTTFSESMVRDSLAQFQDYTTVSAWAKNGLAFCYQSNILDQSVLTIQPQQVILRGEIAHMVYRLLAISDLL